MRTKNQMAHVLRQAGFTLLELLLVLALGVGVSAAGVIGLSRIQALFQLRNSADEIKSQILYGRELAIANKDNKTYSMTLSGSAVSLLANGQVINRYIVPQGIVISPLSFTWNFTPITGAIPSCLSCQLNLTFRGLSETVIIQENGLVN